MVLTACALAWWFLPSIAGFVGGTFWCLLLLIPSVAERKIDDLLVAQRFARARRLAVVRRILHPWEDSPHRPRFARLSRAGEQWPPRSRARSARHRTRRTHPGRILRERAHLCADGKLGGPGAMVPTRLVGDGESRRAFALFPRARRNRRARRAGSPVCLAPREPRAGADEDALPRFNFALVLAFAGRTNDLVRLFAGDLRQMPLERRQFWLATAELAAGRWPRRARASGEVARGDAGRDSAAFGRSSPWAGPGVSALFRRWRRASRAARGRDDGDAADWDARRGRAARRRSGH